MGTVISVPVATHCELKDPHLTRLASSISTLGIVPRMRMRAWVADSTWGRAVGLTLLVLFLAVCGLHFAGAHHDADGDALVLAEGFSVLLVGALLVLAAATTFLREQGRSARSRGWAQPVLSHRGPLFGSSLRGIPLRR